MHLNELLCMTGSVLQLAQGVMGAERRAYLSAELSFAFYCPFRGFVLLFGRLKVRDGGQMAASCLLLSQACSAVSWLDLGSLDNALSGHSPAHSTMWFLHSDFTMSQADFTWKLGVFYCPTHTEQTPSLYLCWQHFLLCLLE